ncbi:D-alanine--D-alanine ligase family protein [Corynebacterium glutamicum]|uniref:D-alanine--D-alanine ligase family protein n=1 Tax=Corynebacterium glutamicum TaxID=1718 RepID=UPI00058A6466|nr:D-alanine--D-alanine ligase family protein [Corynebacterium glutamicum]AJE67275.1 D-alanine--D-alanine ligase [Corynebacterium glutamicum]OKX93417.1 D-alanine--D-alanine ligase A [Corynebacterium glutamicum]TWS38633.1 D-alanine--D-alanine ligase [Corynebacterium glutamicum]
MSNSNSGKVRVAVVYGGRSSEHSVSCVSAGAIMAHLDPEKYDVIPVGITVDGAWVVGETDPQELTLIDRTMPEVEHREEVRPSLDPAHRGEFHFSDGSLYATADVIFPVLHGRFGEDGTVQGLFALSDIPVVGPGVLASAAGMDKEYTKKLMAAEGLPVGREVILRDRTELTEAEKNLLGLPVFVKPARGGSSIGISRVTAWEDFNKAVGLARAHDEKVIVESEIVGSEVECGVLQYPDGRIVASVPALLSGTESGAGGFYDFDTKYLDNVVTAEIPAPLDEKTTELIQSLAVESFQALACEGLARVDFFVTANGPVLNEINTMPGFTPISMYPQMFTASGVAYEELLDVLVQQALHRDN